ncbi:BglII/BstYI family type II restriction endonuclease [Desulforamulus putei]|nr:BglII/BstYI family type II restriction endonuclease [Desulforamulus putei]
MRLQLQKNSYRSANEILTNSPLLKEIEEILLSSDIDLSSLSRSHYNHILRELFKTYGWQHSPSPFHEPVNPFAAIELTKHNIGLEIGFRHASLMGHNLLKFQLSSSHHSDRIDVGIFIVTTKKFQKQMYNIYHHNWAGAMNFEKADRYLRHFKTDFRLPIYLVGIDVA